jgi:hypothetical protein
MYAPVIDYSKRDAAFYGTQMAGPEAVREVFTPGRLSDGTSAIHGFGWRIEQRGGSLIGGRQPKVLMVLIFARVLIENLRYRDVGGGRGDGRGPRCGG